MFKDLTTYQKVILSIYAVVSLPVLPFMFIMYPFTKWAVSGKVEWNWIEFLSMSVAIIILGAMICLTFYCGK
jgi:hypothetical protein